MDERFQRLGQRLVASVVNDVERGLPAAQIAVGFDGTVIWSASIGAADEDTRFPLHCSGKPLLTAAVWRLVGDGLLDLDEPVQTYISEFGRNGKGTVTVRHLLLDAPGLRSQTADEPLNQYVNLFEVQDRQRLRSLFASWKLESEPGTSLGFYQTCVSWILAELITTVSGQHYPDFIHEQVTKPIGLERASKLTTDEQARILPTVEVRGPDQDGHPVVTEGETASNHSYWRTLGCPAGGYFMSATGLATFYQALLDNPGQLWAPEVLKAGTTLQRTFVDFRNGTQIGRSLGLYLAGEGAARRYDQGFALGHSPGAFGMPGLNIQVGWADPATGVSFVYLNNAQFADECAARRGIGLNRLASQLRPGGYG